MATRIAVRVGRRFDRAPRSMLSGAALLLIGAACNRNGAPNGALPPLPPLSGLERVVAERITERRLAVLSEPGSAAAWGRLGGALEVHDFVSEAIVCYDRAAELAPDDFRWIYFAGCARWQSEPGRAVELLKRAVAQNPDYVPMRIRLADALLATGDIEQATRHYREGLALDANYAHAHLGLARAALVNGDVDACVAFLRDAERLAPDNREVHALSATAHGRRGDDGAARSAEARAAALAAGASIPDPLRDGLTSEGVGSEWHLRRGRSYAAAGDDARALSEYEQALALNPGSAVHHYYAGAALAKVGRDHDAIGQLQRAVELRPAYSDARHRLAQLFAKTNRPREAYAQWTRAIADDAAHVDALVGLGAFLLHQGRFADAVGHLARAAELKPLDAECRFQLASAYAGVGNSDAAKSEIDRALACDPTHLAALTRRGLIELREGRANDAVATFEKAVALHPGDAAATNYLGMGYAAVRRCSEAARAFRDGLDRHPENADLTNNLAWLLATSPDPACRDGASAVRLAQQLCERTLFQSPRYMDTLAAAYAEISQFEKALSYADQAVVLVELNPSQSGYLNELRARRDGYRSGQPFRHD